MRYMSATDAEQGFAAALDAAQRAPVVVRREERDVAVLMSMAEYERLTRANVDRFQRFCDMVGERATARGLTDEKLNELLAKVNRCIPSILAPPPLSLDGSSSTRTRW